MNKVQKILTALSGASIGALLAINIVIVAITTMYPEFASGTLAWALWIANTCAIFSLAVNIAKKSDDSTKSGVALLSIFFVIVTAIAGSQTWPNPSAIASTLVIQGVTGFMIIIVICAYWTSSEFES